MIIFEWDEDKNSYNFEIHGLSFEEATMVFDDIHRIERYDTSANNYSDEDRWQTIGKVGDIIFVVYAEDADDIGEDTCIRIVSARLATPKEREMYYGTNRDLCSGGWERVDS